jgi:hypothetical protein
MPINRAPIPSIAMLQNHLRYDAVCCPQLTYSHNQHPDPLDRQ